MECLRNVFGLINGWTHLSVLCMYVLWVDQVGRVRDGRQEPRAPVIPRVRPPLPLLELPPPPVLLLLLHAFLPGGLGLGLTGRSIDDIDED